MRFTVQNLLPILLSLSAAVVTHARSYEYPYDARDSLSSRAAGYYRQDARRFSPYQARDLVDELLTRREFDNYEHGLYERVLRDVPSTLLVRELKGRLGETLDRRGKNQSKEKKYQELSGTDPTEEDTDPAASTGQGTSTGASTALIHPCGYDSCTKKFADKKSARKCHAEEKLRQSFAQTPGLLR